MAERTSYAPGTPSWVDLQTSDPRRRQAVLRRAVRLDLRRPARRRDERLLDGAAARDRTSPRSVVSASRPRKACRRTGTPTSPSPTSTPPRPRSRPRAAPLIAPPFDVMDAGRMAVVAGPDRRGVRALAGEGEHRRRPRQRARHVHVDRADDARHPQGGRVLQRGARLGRGDLGRPHAVHRVQARRGEHRGRDEPADAGDPAVVGDLLRGGRHRRHRRPGHVARRVGRGRGDRHPAGSVRGARPTRRARTST